MAYINVSPNFKLPEDDVGHLKKSETYQHHSLLPYSIMMTMHSSKKLYSLS